MADPVKSDDEIVKDLENNPNVLSERPKGPGSASSQKQSTPKISTGSNKKLKAMNFGNAILGGLSTFTDTAAKMGEASKGLFNGGLPTGGGKKILDTMQGTSNAISSGIKTNKNVMDQFKANKKTIADAYMKDPKHLADFEKMDREIMADLDQLPFEQWDDAKAKETYKKVTDFFSDRGLDVNSIPPNSELGRKLTRLKNEISAKAHEKTRANAVDRGRENLAAKEKKDNARFAEQQKKTMNDAVFRANATQLQNMIDNPKDDEEWALATAMQVVTKGKGAIDPNQELDKTTAEKVAKQLNEMWADEKDPAKKDAIEKVYNDVVERSIELGSSKTELEGHRRDRYIDDSSLSPEDVVSRMRGISDASQSGTYGTNIPTNRRDAMEMSDIATQRTSNYYNRRRAAMAQGNQAEVDRLDQEYGTQTAYQNGITYLNSQMADILRNTRERNFTIAEMNGGTYSPMALMTEYRADDGNGNVDFIPATVLARNRDEYPQVYRQFTNDRKGYMLANVAYQMNLGKDLMSQAQQMGIYGQDTNGNVRSGLDLTIEDLANGGLFDPNNPNSIPPVLATYFTDQYGNQYEWDHNPNRNLRIGDVIGRNIDNELSAIDGQKGKYYHKDTDRVGVSQPEMMAGIWSLVSGHLGQNGQLSQTNPAQGQAQQQQQSSSAQPTHAGSNPNNGTSQNIYDRIYIGSDPNNNISFFTSDGQAKPVSQLTADDYIASYNNLTNIHANGYTTGSGGTATYNPATHAWEGDPDAVNEAIIVENTHNRQKPLKFLKTIIDDQSGVFSDDIKERAADLYEIVMTTSSDTTIGISARDSFTRLLDDIENLDDISNPTVPVFGTQADRIFANAVGLGNVDTFRNMMLLPNGNGTQYFNNASRQQYRADSNDGDPYLAPRNVFARALRGRLNRGYF